MEIKCCSLYVLSQQSAFLEQKPWLTECVEAKGCEIVYYPKFYCELNFIEMVWGWMKSYHRRTSTYNFKDFQAALPRTIEELLPIAFVRKAQRHCFRYMSGYRLDFTGQLLEYSVMKYKSHRSIPPDSMLEVRKQFKESEDKAMKKMRKL